MGETEFHDPHGIIPEQFKDRHGDCETANEALSIAEQRPSTTPLSEQYVCPECGTRRWSPKPGPEQAKRVDTDYKCRNGHHFCDLAEPEPMTHYEPDHPFEWLSTDDLEDPDERGMSPLFGDLDEETRVELAIRLYRPWTDAGPSYRELAELFPHGRGWIGRRVREWKRGEHRDLVEQPGPTVDATGGADAIAVATDGGRRRRWAEFGSD